MPYSQYSQFDEQTGFSKLAGFQLTPMQVKLVEQTASWRKSLNKAEVGCGKTVMSTVTSLMQGYDLTIITAPPILITGWAKWLKQVSEQVLIYRGSPKDREKLREGFSQARWIICSHAIYRDDYAHLVDAVKGRICEVVVDEAQALKNPQSMLYKKVNAMVAGDVGCQMLTGTPVSKPLDAYSYIKIKTPTIYRSYGHFESLHVADRDFHKKPTAFGNLDYLANNFNMQTVSANKEEMHGYNLKPLMPDCSYDLDPAHYKLYAKLVDQQLLEFDDGSIIDATDAHTLRHALQQVVVNWDHYANDPTKKSAVYSVIDQTLEEIEINRLDKSKLIIWVQYKRTARSVIEYINKLGVRTVGAYSEVDTEANVQAFLNDENVRVLVGNPQSCGAGLNPQAVCSEALFLEMSTVPMYMHQAIGRICRVGQTRVPRLKFAVANKTIQVGLLESLLSGDDLMQKVSPTKASIRAMLLGD